MATFNIPTPDATSSETGKVQLAGDIGGTATTPTIPKLIPKTLGSIGIVSHSWAAGSNLSSTGTPQFEQQGIVGRLTGMLGIANENQEHLGIAGSYLARSYNAYGTQFCGWAGVYSFVYPPSNNNINDVSITARSVPASSSAKAWTIIHGINDAAIYGSNTTTINYTQTILAYKNALRAVVSRLRAGALYSSYRNSTGAITWDSSISFGGTGTWSDVVSTGQNTGPAYKSNGSNSGTVTITLPTNFKGGTVAVSFIGQIYAWTLLQGIHNASTTTINIDATHVNDFPASGNYIIKIDNEQMLVTGGQGTAALTVVRGYNSTTAAIHNSLAEVYMVSSHKVDFSGTASNATGSLTLGCQALGGAALGRSFIGLVKRFSFSASDAGKTIIMTTSNIATASGGETYAATQFDSWWIESETPPLISITNVPNIGYVVPYAYLTTTQWNTLNTAITDVDNEFDTYVRIADINTPFYNRTFTVNTSLNNTDVTTTVNITANDPTTFASLGTGWVCSENGEDMLVTANTLVSGSTFSVTLTRGYNSTSKISHSTTRYFSDSSLMSTDNIHPSAFGHAIVADTIFNSFAAMTNLSTYQIAMNNGNITQDNRVIALGLKDNWYMIHHYNVALSQTTTFTLNKLWYFPFYVPQKCILIGAGIVTGSTTAGTSTNVRVGIYDVNVDRYSPGNLIKEFGTSATTALSSAREVTCYQVLNPGWYFLAYVNQGTTAGTVRTMSSLGYTANIPYHLEATGSPTAGASSPFFSDTGSITGALPATAVWQQDNGPIPYPLLHFRAKHYV